MRGSPSLLRQAFSEGEKVAARFAKRCFARDNKDLLFTNGCGQDESCVPYSASTVMTPVTRPKATLDIFKRLSRAPRHLGATVLYEVRRSACARHTLQDVLRRIWAVRQERVHCCVPAGVKTRNSGLPEDREIYSLLQSVSVFSDPCSVNRTSRSLVTLNTSRILHSVRICCRANVLLLCHFRFLFIKFLSSAIPKMFPSVRRLSISECQRCSL